MSVGSVMQEIVNFDCQPSVFNVSLVKSDHKTGFDANVIFRSTHPDALSSLSAHNDDPEKALSILLEQLTKRWGKCEQCGSYQREIYEPSP